MSDRRKSVLIWFVMQNRNHYHDMKIHQLDRYAKAREIYLTIQMTEGMRKNLAINQKTRMKKKMLEEGEMAMEITMVVAVDESIFCLFIYFCSFL
ncbi:MAG: hypothetical protein ACR2IS_14850 [Nitrososphaeraceae archaeon]